MFKKKILFLYIKKIYTLDEFKSWSLKLFFFILLTLESKVFKEGI